MAHDPHASIPHDTGDAHAHPALPPVTDEAPDSPMWLPAAGLGLLALAILFVMIRAASGGDAAGAAGAGEAAGDGAAEVAPEAGAAPAVAPGE